MKKRIVILIAFLGLIIVSCSPTKIACVGDSITQGAGTDDESKSSFPVILDSLLGHKYTVLNCGRSGATLQKKADKPFWKSKDFYNTIAFNPKIVIIALGTNDSKDNNWDASRYETDLQAIIDTLKTMPSKPKIYVCLPPPAFKKAWNINDTNITEGVIPIINKLKKSNNYEIIDLNQKLRNKSEFFPDGIHPNEAGAKLIAEIISGELKK
jgi:acyl-CoA thioesterase I